MPNRGASHFICNSLQSRTRTSTRSRDLDLDQTIDVGALFLIERAAERMSVVEAVTTAFLLSYIPQDEKAFKDLYGDRLPIATSNRMMLASR